MAFTINGTTGIDLGTQPLTGSLPDANAPSGSVIQVVQTVKTDTFSTTSGSLVDVTGMSVSITPTSASNKILVMVHVVGGINPSGGNISFQLQRNGTAVYVGDASGSRLQGFQGGNSDVSWTLSFTPIYLDSPSTTSAVTYKIQARTSNTLFVNRTGEDPDSINRGRTASSITVMEISA
jgi:hypothetical protein